MFFLKFWSIRWTQPSEHCTFTIIDVKVFLSILFTLLAGVVLAQTIHRTFLPVNPQKEKVKVLANGRCAFVMKNKADQSVEIIAFDDEMKELWGIGIVLKYPILHVAQIYEDELALLISDKKRRNFALLEIDAETGHYSFSEYNISLAFTGEQLARYQEQFWVRGWIGEEPVAFRLATATKTLKTLPLGHANAVESIKHFAFDPINQELDLVLQTQENGYQAYLLRSINLKGDITRNQLFNHPGRNITDFRIRKSGQGNIQVVGTLSKKKAIDGLVWFSIEEESLTMKEWQLKGLPGTDRTWEMEDQKLVPRQTKGLKTIDAKIDEAFFSPEGELIVALETFEKDYEVRGLLQRESDEQSLIDQLDQNRYGRRDFDPDESTLNDRVDNFSNTEEATYRYRDVIIDRVQEKGNRHSQVAIFRIKDDEVSGIHLKVPKGVNSTFSITDKNLGVQSYWFSDEEGFRKILFSEHPELITHHVTLGPYIKRIGPEEFLNFGFLVNDKVFYLMLQRIKLNQ